MKKKVHTFGGKMGEGKGGKHTSLSGQLEPVWREQPFDKGGGRKQWGTI